MEGRCDRHPFEGAVDRCQHCGLGFCAACMVYPRGQRNPGYCLPCAVVEAGVRNGAGSGHKIGRKARRQLVKERKLADVVAATAAGVEHSNDSFDTSWMSRLP